MASRRPRFEDNAPDEDEAPRGHRSRRPPTPDMDDDMESRPAPNPRRKSILVDPNEDPRARQERRRSRSNSRVRVKPPPSTYHSSDDEGTVKGNYVRHRNGDVEFVPEDGGRRREPKRRTHDLERKNGDGERRFRERRDGYESEEGDSLRRAKKRGGRDSRDSIGDVDNEPRIEKPKGRSAWDSQQVRPRNGDSHENAFVVPDRTRRRGDREDDVAAGRRRDLARKKYDSDDDDDVEMAPRRRPPQGRDRHERGYDSEGPSRRRKDWAEEDKYNDKRRSARYDDDYGYAPRRGDPRDDRRGAPPRSSRYEDDYYDRRDRPRRDDAPIRRSRSDARARGSDRYDDRRRGGGSSRDKKGGGKNVWAEQAGTLFMTHAMPVIKREGGKWAKSQLETYMAGRR